MALFDLFNSLRRGADLGLCCLHMLGIYSALKELNEPNTCKIDNLSRVTNPLDYKFCLSNPMIVGFFLAY